MRKLILKAFAVALLFGLTATASAATIYIADDRGNVGVYDDVLDTTAVVGDLGGFQISQNLGIAYDPVADRILLLDRSARAVYSMDPATGTASLLFNPSEQFQGGAVKGNLLYGVNEGTNALVAYDLTTFARDTLTGTNMGHTHALGIDTASGQLLAANSLSGVFAVNDDGTVGATLVTGSALPEDIDPLGADYLAVYYSNTVEIIDGTTGARSEYLNATQTAALGMASSISGVVVASAAAAPAPPPLLPAQTIPTMSQWGMLLLISCMLLVVYSRRKLMS